MRQQARRTIERGVRVAAYDQSRITRRREEEPIRSAVDRAATVGLPVEDGHEEGVGIGVDTVAEQRPLFVCVPMPKIMLPLTVVVPHIGTNGNWTSTPLLSVGSTQTGLVTCCARPWKVLEQ